MGNVGKREGGIGGDVASEHIEKLKEISAALPDVDAEIAEVKDELAVIRAVLYVMPRAVVSADIKGRITYFNVEAQRMFGIRESEAIGSALTMLMPERYREAHLTTFAARVSGESLESTVRELDGHGMRSDGSEFPIKIRLAMFHMEKKFAFTAVIEATLNAGG